MPIRRSKPKKTGVPGIRQDGPGRFLVRVDWVDERTGRRRKREAVASSLAEAVQLRDSLRAEPKKHIRQRFGDYAEQWLEAHASELAPSTQERYVAELARIVTVLGDQYVDTLTEQDVLRWRNCLAREVAHSTVNAHLRTLRVVLEPLARQGVLRRNVARDVAALKEGRTKGARGTSLNVEEFGRVIAATRELMGSAFALDIGRMILTVAWTGVRKGELLALAWEDLHQDGELLVRRAVCKVSRTEKVTKTDDPRLVPVAGPLAEVLEEQRRWLIETQHAGLESGLMFPADPAHARGGKTQRALDEVCWYRSDSVLDRPLRLVVAKAEVPRITVHSFRRTYENLLRQAGVNGLVRRSLAGWRTKEAQAIYAGVDREERAQAARAVLKLVQGDKP